MSSSMSKRQQARNERALHDLLSSVPGNDQCADCQARNPGWASWNLGVFLCMRCASLHRKLGTHISKVKSLSMDTWSAEQVETMRRNGNVVVNKAYNPKNVKPGIPLDIDEVDSAMERFIRQKYQDRSLLDGKPRPPPRPEPIRSRSPEGSPPPPLPPKKGKLFGFGLRAHSSAYPLSKHEQKNLPIEPTLENAFRAESQGDKPSKQWRRSAGVIEDADLRDKLATLREMGFPDDRRNTTVLRGLNGDLERTIESLVRLGEGSKPPTRNSTPVGSNRNTGSTANLSEDAKRTSTKAPSISNNPFEQMSGNPPDAGLSFNPSSQQQGVPGFDHQSPQRSVTMPSYNPFDTTHDTKPTGGNLEQAIQGMHISQPIFPNNTGSYQSQPQSFFYDSQFQQSPPPPVPVIPPQYGQYPSQPIMNGNNNPSIPHLQNTGSNSFAPMPQIIPQTTPPSNPFFNQPTSISQTMHSPQEPSISAQNPFGIPPSSPQQVSSQNQSQQYQFPFNSNQQSFTNNATTPPFFTQSQPQFETQYQQQQPQQQSPFQNYTPQQPYSPQSQPGYQPQHQISPNPFGPQFRGQAVSQQLHYGSQPLPLQPQQTGRIDKSSILALYNYPNLAPQQPIPTTIPNSTETPPMKSPTARAPTNDPFGGVGVTPAKRSVTMPVSSTTSRNPFLSNPVAGGGSGGVGAAAGAGASTMPTRPPDGEGPGFSHKHTSHESMSIANLESGRHSPDAFASLSARYVQ